MKVIRKLLQPLSPLFAITLHIRHWLYDRGFFTESAFSLPVICIGNLSVGGTGKTPMTEYLIRLLSPTFKTAVLSRGYRRKTKGFVRGTPNSTVSELGDEPYQYHRKFPMIKVAVDENRVRGVEALIAQDSPQVILLDDAMQHRRIKAGLYILLTAYDALYTEDKLLPGGDLRDLPQRASVASLVVVTKCPPKLSEEEKLDIAKRLHLSSHQELFFATISYNDYLYGEEDAVLLDEFTKSFTLVTGIARPSPLISFLKSKGMNFEHLSYPDHHAFTESDIQQLNQHPCILTTEKDYVRLQGRLQVPLYFLPMQMSFLGKKTVFDRRILRYLQQKGQD